ncbi:MAG: sodium:proton antiporter [Arachnia propionica]|nr:MAG: sodium:proton antiporter [Arachnia propionica]
MRVWHSIRYLGYLNKEILAGSLLVARAALSRRRIDSPAIVAFPLRCNSDIEVTLLASSITLTPGTLVLGLAAASPAEPPTMYIHSLFDNDRSRVVAGLRDMESRLLLALRGSAS